MLICSLLVLAHVISDFTLQTDMICRKKSSSYFFFFIHILIVFFTSLLLTFYFFEFKLLIIIVMLSIIHGIIDLVKIILNKWTVFPADKYKLELFLADQFLHIIIILGMYPLLKNIIGANILKNFFNLLTYYYPVLQEITPSLINLLVIVLLIVIFNFKGGTLIVRYTLQKYRSDMVREGKKGKAIGNLERLLVLVFIISNYYSLIGLLFTAKSLIRFKEIDTSKTEEGFVEYYLIGSFVSILTAVVSGLVIKYYYLILL